ncbi:MAG: replication restart helicase PriA [Planctomycetota bacterium]|jgi:primosomal protein N' (replication factor Y)
MTDTSTPGALGCKVGPALVEVATPFRVGRTFIYTVPVGQRVRLGARVLVPFGKKKEAEGFVVGFPEKPPPVALKEIHAVLDDRSLLSMSMLKFTRWIARYYRAAWGEVLNASIPPGARMLHAGGRDRKAVLAVERAEAEKFLGENAKRSPAQARILQVLLGQESGEMLLKDLVRLCETSYSPVNGLAKHKIIRLEKVERSVHVGTPEEPPPAFELTRPQADSLDAIAKTVKVGDFGVFLLRGVTGSGKTEVYLRAIEAAQQSGKGAISLVPEISLTPQMVGRYLARFPRVAVLHSSLTNRERAAQWESIRKGDAEVVVGARSALFAPVPKLGLIVVDEEHEPSFKQDSSPRYHARDAAVVRAREEGAVVILGSATPSLESFQNAEEGKYQSQVLPRRVKDLALPEVEIVDLSAEARETRRLPIFSRRLEGLARETLGRGEQVIFFLNRRGYSTFLQCTECGFRYECPQCGITLTYHKKIDRAICHYCYHGEVPTDSCPSCLSPGLKYQGIGTEKVEDAVSKLYPSARVARMDSDSMTSREDYERVFRGIKNREIDVLVGTQMIAKGLDFPDVTLVGVVSADASLGLPDFRAAERTFQLITQVAGRAGRSEKGGRVVVQTFQPDHYSIRCASAQDYLAFTGFELKFRRELGYPPFGKVARVLFTGKNEDGVRSRARAVGKRASEAARRIAGASILGPAPAPLVKIRNKFRYQLVIKGASSIQVQAVLDALGSDLFAGGAVRIAADVDPQSML